MSLQILFIAADPPENLNLPKLNWSSETEILGGSDHKVTYILGNVTFLRLLQTIRGRQFDIIHFACHGGESGIFLSDGELPPESILRLSKGSGAELVFLNSCYTPKLGQTLVDRGVPNVLVYNTPVLDNEALSVAVFFYQKLRGISSIEEVTSEVSSGDGSLSLLSRTGGGEISSPILSVSGEEIAALRSLIESHYRIGRTWDVVTLAIVSAIILYVVFFLR